MSAACYDYYYGECIMGQTTDQDDCNSTHIILNSIRALDSNWTADETGAMDRSGHWTAASGSSIGQLDS